MIRGRLRNGCSECLLLADLSAQILKTKTTADTQLLRSQTSLVLRRGVQTSRLAEGITSIRQKISHWNKTIPTEPRSAHVMDLNQYVHELVDNYYFSSENLFLLYDYLFREYEQDVPPKIVESVVSVLKMERVPEGTKVDLLILLLLRLSKLEIELPIATTRLIYTAWIPYTKNDQFIALLDQLQEAPSPSISTSVISLKIHAYITLGKYDDAVSTLALARGQGDNFVIDLLAYHLVSKNEVGLLQDLVSIFVRKLDEDYTYIVPFSSQILESMMKKSIEKKNFELANSLFLKLVYLTDYPKFNLTDGLIKKFTNLAAESLHFSSLDKIMRYKIKKITNSHLHYKEKNKELALFKNEMNILKLNAYVNHLGAKKVIERGMFAVFRFHQTPDISVKDFKKLTNVLTKELRDGMRNSKKTMMTVNEAILFSKQMNGYHVMQHKQRFSIGLHPDEQINRILAGRIRPMDITSSNLSERFPVVTSRVGKPRNTTVHQMQKPIKYYDSLKVLPINIILSVIANLTTTKTDFRVALQLAKTMLSKRVVAPNNETLLYLIRILQKAGETNQLLYLIDSFPGLRMTPRCFKLVFNILLETERIDDLFQFLETVLSKNVFLISNQMYDDLKSICDKMDDKRYLKYKPTVFEIPKTEI